MNVFLLNWSPRVLSVLRFIVGFLMIWHGSQKLFGFPSSGREEALSALMLFAGILEFVGGVLFIVGFFTRFTGFIMSGLMAVAYFMAHASGGFLPIVNKGEMAVLYSFVFLYFAFAGGGSWSLDKLIWKKE